MSYLRRFRDPLLPDDAIDVKLIPSISDFLGREDSDWPSLTVVAGCDSGKGAPLPLPQHEN